MRDIPKRKHWKVAYNERLQFLRLNVKTGRHDKYYDTASRRIRFDLYRTRHLPDICTQECYLCGVEPHGWHHIVQLHMGGADCRLNLVPLCRGCHKRVHRHHVRRGNRLPDPPYVSPFVKPVQNVVVIPPRHNEGIKKKNITPLFRHTYAKTIRD